MKRILSFLLAAAPLWLFAQEYKVSLIPDSLRTDANAVCRLEEMRVVIKGIDKAVIKHKYAITILNENGDRFAQYINYYSNLVSLSDISGRLLDADGKVLRTVRRKDISDMSGSDDETMLTDTRTKSYSFYNKTYPYTVEFEDEQEYNGIFYLPSWGPVAGQKFSVQESRFIVETPVDYQLRYKQFNLDTKPVIATGKTLSYTWEIRNRKAIRYEPWQPAREDILPDVYIAPSEFSIGSYKGNMSTWAGLGKFITELNKNRSELPESTKSILHKLTDGTTDAAEKARRVYKYLQENTRYVGIQLGIGGWQPFEAKFVAEKKYGDCKALSNYMVSMLKEVGVKAHYVLIRSGDDARGLSEDFPAPHFTHVVCCVPTGKDSLWFECTSQTNSPGFMGSFTGDRLALLIDDDGGHVVRTPQYKANDNNQFRRIKAVVDENGNMVADVYTRATGIQQENMHDLIHTATGEQREKYLNQVLSLPTYTVEKSEYKETQGPLPVIDEYLHVKAQNYASVSGKRLFVQPNLFNRSAARFTDEGDRKFPIHFSYAFRDIDTVQITIPAGYSPEAIPKNLDLQTRFGRFQVVYSVKDNAIEVIRTQVRERAEFPASDYGEMVKYFEAIYKADRSRIVFVKKDS